MTNPRLLVTGITIVLGATIIVDFVLQILVHYGRIGYTNIMFTHELKWPWLYCLSWCVISAVPGLTRALIDSKGSTHTPSSFISSGPAVSGPASPTTWSCRRRLGCASC